MSEQIQRLFTTRAEQYPEPTAADKALGTTRAAIAGIPLVGGSITEGMSVLFSSPLANRRDQWFREFASDFDRLEERVEGCTIESMVQNEVFVTAAIQATRIALSTHQVEKRALLRNALLNIAIGQAPSEDMQHVYLRFIDEFTPSHVTLLYFLWTCNQRAATANGGTLPQASDFEAVLEMLEPELQRQGPLVQQILEDLRSRGLATLQKINYAFPQQVVTNAGISFLQFVLLPEDLQ